MIFADMFVMPKDENALEKMLELREELDIGLWGVNVNKDIKIVKKLSSDIMVNYVVQANTLDDLKKNIKDAKKVLSRYSQNKYTILKTTSYEVARIAVEKRKVDAIMDLPLTFEMFNIDEVVISLASKNNVALMFNLKTFRDLSKNDKVRYLRNMRKILEIAYRKDVMAFPVSGAYKPYDMVKARDLSSFFFVCYRNLRYSLKSLALSVEFAEFIKKLNDESRVLPGLYVHGEGNA